MQPGNRKKSQFEGHFYRNCARRRGRAGAHFVPVTFVFIQGQKKEFFVSEVDWVHKGNVFSDFILKFVV